MSDFMVRLKLRFTAEEIFQLADLLAHRSLGDTKFLSSDCEAAVPGSRFKHDQTIEWWQFFHRIRPKLLIRRKYKRRININPPDIFISSRFINLQS